MVGPESKAAVVEVVSLLRDISPLVATASTAFFIIWAILRAKSAHFLLDKIWRLIGGGAINDQDLKKDWLQIRDLESFRFRTGIKFNSRNTWSKTVKWLEYNDKSMNDLSFAKAWISGKPWDFNEPWLKQINVFVFCIFLMTVPLIMGMTYIFSEQSAILTIKGSEKTFWTDGVTARNFELAKGTPQFSVDSAACINKKIPGLDDKDSYLICKTLEPEAIPQLKKFILEQKILSAYMGFICLLALLISVRYAARAKMAKTFYELPPPRIEPTQ
ncbi:DUF6216 family protein [Pseudomonas sp. lyk4-R2A-10]|jgi:hypothetical protein|uniref:DUF6216 family protein n=1 Tax=Pseudomonas sp. lyk4-R2A-10 TaxID=3040315 RepID=UPI002555A9EF|nr:DUF6216 family protein [Pseudomonas sp. lyk4-R2A-10]